MSLYKVTLKYTGTQSTEHFAKNKAEAVRKAKIAVKTHIQGNVKSKLINVKQIK